MLTPTWRIGLGYGFGVEQLGFNKAQTFTKLFKELDWNIEMGKKIGSFPEMARMKCILYLWIQFPFTFIFTDKNILLINKKKPTKNLSQRTNEGEKLMFLE